MEFEMTDRWPKIALGVALSASLAAPLPVLAQNTKDVLPEASMGGDVSEDCPTGCGLVVSFDGNSTNHPFVATDTPDEETTYRGRFEFRLADGWDSDPGKVFIFFTIRTEGATGATRQNLAQLWFRQRTDPLGLGQYPHARHRAQGRSLQRQQVEAGRGVRTPPSGRSFASNGSTP